MSKLVPVVSSSPSSRDAADPPVIIRLNRSDADYAFTGERFVPGIVGDIAQEHFHRYLFALSFCRGKDVLDVASGEGYGAALLSNVAQRVYGVEDDREAVKHARSAYPSEKVQFLTGDATQIPLPTASVDVAVSFETLEHIAAQEKFLSELKRVMRDDGVLVVSTPDTVIYSPNGPSNPYHVNELDAFAFRRLLGTYFTHVTMYRQKIIAGSAICAEDAKGLDNEPTVFERSGQSEWHALSTLRRGVYMVAVASNRPLDLPPCSLLVDYEKVWAVESALETASREKDAAIAERAVRDVDVENLKAHVVELERAVGDTQREMAQSEAARTTAAEEVSTLTSKVAELESALTLANEAAAEAMAAASAAGDRLGPLTSRAADLEQQLGEANAARVQNEIDAAAALTRAVEAEDLAAVLSTRMSDLESALAFARAAVDEGEQARLAAVAQTAQTQQGLDILLGRAGALERALTRTRSIAKNLADAKQTQDEANRAQIAGLAAQALRRDEDLAEARATIATSEAAAGAALLRAAQKEERLSKIEADHVRKVAEVRRLERELVEAQDGARTARDHIVVVEQQVTAGEDRAIRLARELERAGMRLGAEQIQSNYRESERLGIEARLGLMAGSVDQPDVIEARGGRRNLRGRLAHWRLTPGRVRDAVKELRRNGLFDQAFYRRTHMAGRGNAASAWLHFLRHGLWNDCSPHPLFDPGWYRSRRGNDLSERTPAIVDYLANGLSTKTTPHPLFDVAHYLERVPQILVTGQNPLGHYVTEGWQQGISPHVLFNPRYYRSQKPAGLAPDQDPLVHFVTSDAAIKISPHVLFDSERYLAMNDDVQRSGINPLVHYLSSGGAELRSPHQSFDSRWYTSHNPETAESRSSPLAHYLEIGESVGLWPNELFDPVWYRNRYGNRIAAGESALEHFLTKGVDEGCWPNALFDTAWYRDSNSDIVATGDELLGQYARQGEREHRKPNRYFDPDWYLATYPDVKSSDMLALRHYLVSGRFEGRRPNAEFDPATYLAKHPEAAMDGFGAFAHYVQAQSRERELAETVAGGHVTTTPAPVVEAVPVAVALPQALSLPDADGVWEWRDCEPIKAEHRARERQRIETMKPRPVDMIHVDARDLGAAADALSFKAEAEPLVSILVPVYNNIQLTLECLTSIARNTGEVSYEVIIADDASRDETASLIARVANVRHVRQAENLNFLRNCNTAATSARGRYLLILNNDAQVRPGWLSALVTVFEEEGAVGAVGPKFVYPNGRLQEAGAYINTDGTTTMVGLFDDPDLPRFNFRHEVDYCSGACLLVETRRFLDMGGFADELAPAYCEDSDLCLRLREQGLKIFYEPRSVVVHHLSKTTAAVDDSFKMRAVAVNQNKLVARWQETFAQFNDVRTIAFYLPQFHPIPENDLWWGAGFTEWRNVGKAHPNFVGHYQPRRPAELGYYDLRMPEAMEAQAALAQRYGVSGFCYYYYWFAGKRLLERPIEQMLASGRPALPFCLCWANENWTRRWDGENDNILVGQKHSPEDDLAVIADLARYFRSPAYIRIDGRPLLLVYRVRLFPDFRATVQRWRDWCRSNGIGEIYVATVEAFDQVGNIETPEYWGCDAGVEFPPHGFGDLRKPSAQLLNPRYEGMTDDYVELVHRYLKRPLPGYKRFRGVMAGWDNTPRRQNNSLVFENATPGAFQAWLEIALQQTREQAHGEERIVFINAWNEWAEGAYLEPDMRFGHTWLEAVRNACDAHAALKR